VKERFVKDSPIQEILKYRKRIFPRVDPEDWSDLKTFSKESLQFTLAGWKEYYPSRQRQ